MSAPAMVVGAVIVAWFGGWLLFAFASDTVGRKLPVVKRQFDKQCDKMERHR